MAGERSGKRDMGRQIKEGMEVCLRSLGVTRRSWAQEFIVVLLFFMSCFFVCLFFILD